MAFDINAARADGLSDEQILQHLIEANPGFDLKSAQADGLKTTDIINHLSGITGIPVEKSESPTTSPVGYIAKKALSGFLSAGSKMALAAGPESGMIPGTPEGDALLANAQPGAANQLVFGTPTPTAPGPISRYAGAVTEAAGENPVLAAAFPYATAGGAIVGEAGADLTGGSTGGRVTGGLIGGGLGQMVETGVNALRGVGQLSGLIPKLGSAKTYQDAGGVIQAKVNDWMESLPERLKQVYAPLDAVMHREPIAAGTGVPATTSEISQSGHTLPGESYAPAIEGQPGTLTYTVPQGARQSVSRTIQTPSTDSSLPAGADIPIPDQTSTVVTNPGIPAFPGGPRMPNGPQTPVPEFSQTLWNVVNNPEAEGFGKGLAKIGSGPLKSLLDEFTSSGVVGQKGSPGRPQSWDAVSALSHQLGDMIGNPRSQLNSIDEAKVKALYAALQADRRSTADLNGAGQLFDQTQANAEQLLLDKTRLSQYVKPDSKGLPTDPENAAGLALRGSGGKGGGGSDLSILRLHAPEAADELAAAHLTQTPRDWMKLSPEAKAALVPDQVVRNQIETAVGRILPRPSAEDTQTMLHSLVSGGFGSSIGAVAGHYLFGDTMLGAETGLGVGEALALTPAVGKAIIRNPRVLIGPAVGATAAEQNYLNP